MAIGKKWAGKLYGTNTGNLYVTLEGEDSALTGKIHLNDPDFGVVVYAISGAFDGDHLKISGEFEQGPDGPGFGQLTANANLTSRGELQGDWITSSGTAGTILLFPHDIVDAGAEAAPIKQEQLHTARHDFGAMGIDREQLEDIADELQREFPQSEVVVTVWAGTEKSCLLSDFPQVSFTADRATLFKLYARQRQSSGIDRVAIVEFGPQANYVMTQAADEAWVLGMLEKLKLSLKAFERKYATSFQKYGFGINQLLVLGAVIYLPSLPNLQARTIFMAGVLAIIWFVSWLHSRYLPFAALYLTAKPKGVLTRLLPSAVSWMIAVTSAVAATMLAQFLQGFILASP